MATELPASLAEVVRNLLERHPAALTLDALAEAIGERPVTPPQIDEMMRRLEAQGRVIEPPESMDLPRLLGDVLRAARELQRQGEVPTAQNIAARLEVPLRSVHGALLFSRTLAGEGS